MNFQANLTFAHTINIKALVITFDAPTWPAAKEYVEEFVEKFGYGFGDYQSEIIYGSKYHDEIKAGLLVSYVRGRPLAELFEDLEAEKEFDNGQ